MLYMKKQFFTNFGTPPGDIDIQDYDDLLQTMAAEPEEERIKDTPQGYQNMLEALKIKK